MAPSNDHGVGKTDVVTEAVLLEDKLFLRHSVPTGYRQRTQPQTPMFVSTLCSVLSSPSEALQAKIHASK